jgi:phosphoserine phosphatase
MTARKPALLYDWAPFDVVIFDCDSTLVDVEGIDELARWRGRAEQVAELTRRAMDGELPLDAVYGRRLQLLEPTRDELRRLAAHYAAHLLPDARSVIAALQATRRRVFIVSGGLAEAVVGLGISLGLPTEHVLAVHTDFDELSGRWWETWKHPLGRNPDAHYLDHDNGPLTGRPGKAAVIVSLRRHFRGRAMLIGDGVSDLEAAGTVDLFVGFGGIITRARVRNEAAVFVHTASLAAVLPLALARPKAPAEFAGLYARGITDLREGAVTFQSEAARQSLLRRLVDA